MKKVQQMTNSELISYMRSRIDNNDDVGLVFCENEFNERYYDDLFIKHSGAEDYWRNSMRDHREKVNLLKEELDSEWIRLRRLEYLKKAMIDAKNEYNAIGNEMVSFMNEVSKFMDGYDGIIRGIYRKMLKIANRKYKKLFIDYGLTNKEMCFYNAENSRELLMRCREIPVEQLITGQSVNAGSGRKKYRCPFHDEKTPSFVIYPDNSWYCFGCSVHGNNAIDFVMKQRDCEFLEAFNYLKAMA